MQQHLQSPLDNPKSRNLSFLVLLLPTFFIAFIGIVGVAASYYYVKNLEDEKLRQKFNVTAETFHLFLSAQIREVIIEINSEKRFFEGSYFVDRMEFASFVSQTIENSEDITGVFWVPEIKHSEKKELENNNWLQGLAGTEIFEESHGADLGTFYPVREKKSYTPVLFAEPMPNSSKIIGADLSSNAPLAQLLKQARDEDTIVPISGNDSYFLELTGLISSSSDIFLVQPVYNKPNLETIKQRRDSIKGYLILQFNIGQALEVTLANLSPVGVDTYIIDVEAPKGEEIIHHHSFQHDSNSSLKSFRDILSTSDLAYKKSIDVSGRQWKFIVFALPQYIENNKESQSFIILFLGSMLSLLLVYISFTNQRQTKTTQETVQLKTRELKESEEHNRTLIENIAEGVITIDDKGIIETFNNAAEIIFGYNQTEAIGQNIKFLVPDNERNLHDGYLKHSTLYSKRIINQARDIFGQRKDGTIFPMELNVSAVNIAGHRKFIGIMHDISERQEFQNSLQKAKEEADKANLAKSEFLSSMSHELRTPMNAIIGFGQMLQNSTRDPLTKMQAKCVNHIMTGGWHLLELINQVLDLAQIESGLNDITLEKVNIKNLYDDTVPLISAAAENNKIQIIAEELPDCFLLADPTRLKQIILNLLSNAVKYNVEGGSITIKLEIFPTSFRFSVIDTGLGISSDKQQYIYEPFNRLGTENSGIEGTGIGLNITKKLVQLMNGTVGFTSEQGVGSTFWIEFPTIESQLNTMEKEPSDNKFVDATDMNQDPSHIASILYVEDMETNAELMSMFIKQEAGLELLLAATAQEGIEIAREKQPDLIIMDINLPGMDGFQALERLKSSHKTSHIPVVALSAEAMQSHINKGLEAGFLHYLTKPVKLDQLLVIIDEILKSKQTVH